MGIHLHQWLAHRGVILARLSPRFFQIIYRSFNIFPLPCRKKKRSLPFALILAWCGGWLCCYGWSL